MKKEVEYVNEIMTTDVVSVDSSESLLKAAELMTGKEIGSLVVIEKGMPVGIITERDILRKVVAKNILPNEVTVAQVMSYPLVYITGKIRIDQAAKKMAALGIRRLPIVEKNRLIGIITEKDVLKVFPDMIKISRKYIDIKDMRHIADFPEGRSIPGVCESCGNYSYGLIESDGKLVCRFCREG